MLRSLAIDLTGFTIGVTATVLFGRLRREYSERRPARKLLHLDFARPTWIVMSRGRDRDHHEMTYRVSPTVSKAATEIESFIRSIAPNAEVRVVVSGATIADHLRDNLIILGGPVNNDIARMVADQLGPDFPYQFEGWTLTSSRSGRHFEADVRDDEIVQDFALVHLGENPLSSSTDTEPPGGLIWIAGCRTYGCLAGARSLIRSDVNRTLSTTRGAWPIAFVVSGLVKGDEVLRARVEDVTPLTPTA